MLKGVLFDLGGTLQEYKHEDWDEIVRTLNRDLYSYLSHKGYAERFPPLDAFLEMVNRSVQAHRESSSSTLRSHGMADVLRAVFKEQGIEGEEAEEYLTPWYRYLTDIGYIKPDVEPALRYLKERGLKLGLVSNTGWPAAIHDPDLERFGIKDLLDCRIYSCEAGWEKPAPAIFLAALDCMGLLPEETAFVGDFLRYDVAGAQAVGMKGIWKRVPDRPSEVDDQTVVPDAVIEGIGEVPAALERIYGWRP
jgi:putative hydrolase of the HAD superfamily